MLDDCVVISIQYGFFPYGACRWLMCSLVLFNALFLADSSRFDSNLPCLLIDWRVIPSYLGHA